MLVLTLRHGGETNDHLVVDTPTEQIKIEILDVRNGKVRLGVHAGQDIVVMRKKVLDAAIVAGWDTVPTPMSTAWKNHGIDDGWQIYEDARGRIFRNKGRIWQMKLEFIEEVTG